MIRNWTFGQKVMAGFAVTVALALVISGIAVYTLRRVVDSKDRVITVTARDLMDTQRLNVSVSLKSSSIRGYLLSPEERHIALIRERRADFLSVFPQMLERARDSEARNMLGEVQRREAAHEGVAQRVIAMKKAGEPPELVLRAFDQEVQPEFDALIGSLDVVTANREQSLERETQAANATAADGINLVIVLSFMVVLLAAVIAVVLARTLGRQIGTAVSQVQSSSTELQTAANQQATATKEQAIAMSEITTTITELLATSRQIAESARRVAQVADQTATSARLGDVTVDKAHESITAIRRQVDLIVGHMLELGKKSQQIGAVLDIVAELAEQTNILAINATIEAAGAGESGKRFSVVADEIRKLADRVAGSTKEIRGLIDDVRSSVNTTVMTTESGSKAVDAGSKHFSEVASAFKHIAGLVSTTTEAAKEIELSTKQQTTAVEQVDVAITNVAQATKETEVSSGQTLQTASQLTGLSSDLLRLVQPEAQARPSFRAHAS